MSPECGDFLESCDNNRRSRFARIVRYLSYGVGRLLPEQKNPRHRPAMLQHYYTTKVGVDDDPWEDGATGFTPLPELSDRDGSRDELTEKQRRALEFVLETFRDDDV